MANTVLPRAACSILPALAIAGLAQQAGACGGCVSAGPTAHTPSRACTLTPMPGHDQLALAFPVFEGEVPDFRLPRVFSSRSASVPVLDSRPGAAKTIYLDFDGHTEASLWADAFNGGQPLVRPAFNIEGTPDTFTQTELNTIYEVWERVAEDYAPFDVNVSTVEPPVLGFGIAVRVVIDNDNSWFGGAGGVAAGLFTINEPFDLCCWVFVNGTGNGWPKGMAEAASHEAGHTLGLDHQARWENGQLVYAYSDGDWDGGDGTNGEGSWGPLMGVGYYTQVTTFYDGPTPSGENDLQDDLAIVNLTFPFAPDDIGASAADGRLLSPDAAGAFSEDGLINNASDADAFVFELLGGGDASITVSPKRPGPNLDAVLEIVGVGQGVLATDNPASDIDASIDLAGLDPGTYLAVVKPRGLYGRFGQYTISGTITDNGVQEPCPGDATGDGQVGTADLLVLLANWGGSTTNGDADGDFDASGNVGTADLLILLAAWGTSC
jgi:hypothetical protein